MWVSGTAASTEDRGQTTDYVIQFSPETATGPLDGVESGEFAVLRNDGGAVVTEVTARVQFRDGCDPGVFGVDETLRCALGVERGDTIEVTTLRARRGKAPELGERLRLRLDSVLGVRTEVCRVRMAVNPDLENRVCRLPRETLQLLGVEPGGRVVLSAPGASPVTVKALPVSEDTEDRTEKMEELEKQNKYIPSNCADTLGLNEVHAEDDIPDIYIDRDLRERLGLQTGPPGHSLCKPVHVAPDSTDFVVSVFHDLSVPIVLGAIGLVVGLDGIGPLARIGLMVGAIGLTVLFAMLYRSRRF